MQQRRNLSLQIAGAIALATLFGTSAFAESRHPQMTRGRSGPSFGRMTVRAPRVESRGWSSRSFGSRGVAAPRFGSRGSTAWHGSRHFGRPAPFRGNVYNSGSRFFGRGRIERIVPYRSGYRIWLGGWGYPFFVPYRFYDPFRFRVGLFIGFNAFYDPLGFYSVYGWPGYAYPPVYAYGPTYDRYSDRYTAETLRGIVESIDLHSGHVVVNDDVSHRSITVLLPPRDRRVDDIRAGDYVEFSGEWVRGRGYDFDADRMERFEPRR